MRGEYDNAIIVSVFGYSHVRVGDKWVDCDSGPVDHRGDAASLMLSSEATAFRDKLRRREKGNERCADQMPLGAGRMFVELDGEEDR